MQKSPLAPIRDGEMQDGIRCVRNVCTSCCSVSDPSCFTAGISHIYVIGGNYALILT